MTLTNKMLFIKHKIMWVPAWVYSSCTTVSALLEDIAGGFG